MTDKQEHEAHTDENKLIAQRREKLQAIRNKRNAFPNDFRRSILADHLHAAYDHNTREELENLQAVVRIAGRIIRMRGPFMVIQDMRGQIQLYFNFKNFSDAQNAEVKSWDLGDIIGVKGEVFKTGKGELSVRVSEMNLLTKALRPLPDKHKGLTDTEVRYRQRYLDLIANEEVRKTFVTRSRIINAIRQFMLARDFMEVETPMMHVIPGGAIARPFVTHHNTLNQDMYLRVAPELHLKRLVVGGFEKVFEINRNFRNEGLSTRHNPEFTTIEFYQAYADYHDLMELTEDMLRIVTKEVLGTTQVSYQGLDVDFEKPFACMTVAEAILAHVDGLSTKVLNDEKKLRALADKLGLTVKDEWGKGRIQMEIFDEKVEHLLQQPTFITEYPAEVSPLARRNDDNPEVTDRFELYIGGREIANAFSELNDPEDQAERFRQQVAEKEAGDNEAMHYDADYITALEYGLPPTAGEGIGLDRLVMLLTDSPSIRDVLLFPHMRPAHD